MALEPSFSEAFIHALKRPFRPQDPWSAHRVLGRRLRPFSLWHLLLLQEMESPLSPLVGGEAMPGDVAAAVAVCRCRYGEVRMSPGVGLRGLWHMAGRKAFAATLAGFREYVADFYVKPDYTIIPSGTGGGTSATCDEPPEIMVILADAMASAQCTRAEGWEMPVGEALWWQAMTRRARGVKLDFMTAEEIARREKLKSEEPELYAAMLEATRQFEMKGGG